MGVRATLPNFKSLTFDGENSRDYGVYITGQAVFNAPERNVEMVEIPGRNGAYALDKGNFNNIEVTYPAGIFADSLTDFAEAVSDFRNFLCSRTGYVRLTDDYNPDEYRLAVYKSGLEVTPTQLIAGEFNITFECKPQRYLTSGEDLIEVGAWGETEEVSGSIATFNVTDEDTKVKSLKVDINPIQDLHGYDSPWVGGAGKNKCDTTKLSVVGTSNIHGYYTDGFTLEANKAYTLSVSSACAQLAFQDYSSGSNLAVSYGKTWVTYTPTVDTLVKFDAFYNASYPAPSGGLDSVNVQLEQNASQTSFEPFANLCPISGWDSVGVVECGVNVWDGTGTDGYNLNSVGGTYASQTSFVTNIIKVVPNAQYYLNPTNWRQYVNFFSDKDGNDFVGQVSAVSNVITVPQNGNYAQFGGILAEKATASINYPSTDHDYHAYNGHTYTATLPSTTYGGVLDLVSGDGSNKYDLLDLSLLSWDAGDAPRYRSRQTSYNEGNGWNGSYTNIKSNCFVAENPNLAFADRSDYSIANIKQNYYNIDIKMPSGMFADATAFKAWLGNIDGNNTHAVMLIEKATPTTFSVTGQSVSILKGQNNLFADSGDVDIEYGHDPNVLVNPTLFDSRPQLQVWGYGDIAIGAESLTVNNVVIGPIVVLNGSTGVYLRHFDDSSLNSGDTITISSIDIKLRTQIKLSKQQRYHIIDLPSISTQTNCTATTDNWWYSYEVAVYVATDTITFSYGTASTFTASVEYDVDIKDLNDNTTSTTTITANTTCVYDGVNTIQCGVAFVPSSISNISNYYGYTFPDIIGNSTKSALGNPMYIDLDIGEAYNLDSGTAVSVNDAVSIPAELPTLPPGDTTITYDNTITQLKVLPRWWKV